MSKAHPSLQRRLLGFLREIPASKVPGWVMTGFEKVFTDGAVKQDWDSTLKEWIGLGESKQLKAAAQMAKKKP